MDFNEKRAARFQLLKAFYDLGNGVAAGRIGAFPVEDVGETLGFDASVSLALANYLMNEGLIEYLATGPLAAITHAGIKQVEKA